MTEEWTIAGDYVEACNCDVGCQCIWLEAPSEDVCTASLAWHIREGHYGDVDLAGLSVAMLIETEEGVMFGPGTQWDVLLLIDESADDAQRAALRSIYFGQAGGIWAAVAEAHVRSADVSVAPIEFTRDGADVSVGVPDVLTLDATGLVGFNDELGTISPHPLTSDLQMHTGKSTAASASLDGFEWDLSGTNAYLGDFQLANT